jgi:AcrR family transcriptional regulator
MEARTAPGKRRTGVREAAAQATRESILRAATKVFTKYGFDGGSVDKISTAAKTHDRMIYYYFGSKEGLFVAVLEGVYDRMNAAEAAIELDSCTPVDALAKVIRCKLEYYRSNPDFVTLLNNENLHKGRHIAKSTRAGEYSSRAVGYIEKILSRGTEQGVFRTDLKARDVYLLVVSACYFYHSNRYTLTKFLDEPLEAQDRFEHWMAFVTESVMRVVRADVAAPSTSR